MSFFFFSTVRGISSVISVFQICNASFATRDRLRSHLACHEDKIPCKVCGKFLRAAYMTDHLKKHSEGTHNYCGICNKGNSFKKQNSVVLGFEIGNLSTPYLDQYPEGADVLDVHNIQTDII